MRFLVLILFIVFELTSAGAQNNIELFGFTSYGGSDDCGTFFTFNTANNQYNLEQDFKATTFDYPESTGLVEGSNQKLYGITSKGGYWNQGVAFEYDYSTLEYKTVKHFKDSVDGLRPMGELLIASNGKLYGVTKYGGSFGKGVFFEIDTQNYIFRKLVEFNGVNGENPTGFMVESNSGIIYGLTHIGGQHNQGVVFQYDINNQSFSVQEHFGGNVRRPIGSIVYSNNSIYGVALQPNNGCIYKYDINLDTILSLDTFELKYGNGHFGVVKHPNGNFYGSTSNNSSLQSGPIRRKKAAIYEFNPNVDTLSLKLNTNTVIKYPPEVMNDSIVFISDKRFLSYNPNGNTYIEFKRLNFWGIFEYLTPTFASDGNLYGHGKAGNLFNSSFPEYGIIYKIDLQNDTAYSVLENIYLKSDFKPTGDLTTEDSINFYGTAESYDAYDSLNKFIYNKKHIFKYNRITKNFSVIYDSLYSEYMIGLTVQNDKLYWITSHGGGIIISYDINSQNISILDTITPADNTKFCRSSSKIYGIDKLGGINNKGRIFKIDSTNTVSTTFNFSNSSIGERPVPSLVEGNNGVLFGLCYDVWPQGMRLFGYDTRNDSVYIVKDFDTLTPHFKKPRGPMVVNQNGDIYGLTVTDIFKYDRALDAIIYVHQFNFFSGIWAQEKLMLGSNGKIYGMTTRGGQHDFGVIYEFDTSNDTYSKVLDFTGANGRIKYSLAGIFEINNTISKLKEVKEEQSNSTLNVFPNPFKGIVKVNLSENYKWLKVELYSLSGNSIIEKYFYNKETFKLNLEQLPKGVYLLKVSNNKFVKTGKIIKN